MSNYRVIEREKNISRPRCKHFLSCRKLRLVVKRETLIKRVTFTSGGMIYRMTAYVSPQRIMRSMECARNEFYVT